MTDLEKVQKFIYDNEVQETLDNINNYLLPINVLEISGMGNQEIKHSNVLAWMFGDNEHQLDYQILEKFLREVASLDGINRREAASPDGINREDKNLKDLRHYAYFPKNKRDITIKREWKNIDLLIEDKANKVVIVIENKVSAEESNDQLKHYQKKIQQHYKTYKTKDDEDWGRYYIFLTPDGADVKDEENKIVWLNADYQPIYHIVKNILEKSGKDIPDEARILLESYNDLLIKESVVTNSDIQDLCVKIWNKPEYRDALNILIKNEPDGIDDFLEKLREELDNKKIGIENLYKRRKTYFQIRTENYNDNSVTVKFGFYVVRSDIYFWCTPNSEEDITLLTTIKDKLNNTDFNTKRIQTGKSKIRVYAENIAEGVKDNSGKYNLTDKDKVDELIKKFLSLAEAVDECL